MATKEESIADMKEKLAYLEDKQKQEERTQSREIQAVEDKDFNEDRDGLSIRVLKKYALDTNKEESEIDPSKYSHLRDHHDEDKVKMLSEWQDKDEVYSANTILLCADFVTEIMGNSEPVKALQRSLELHLHQHEMHMTSYKRQSRREDIYAVKGDNESRIPLARDIAKQFGVGR